MKLQRNQMYVLEADDADFWTFEDSPFRDDHITLVLHRVIGRKPHERSNVYVNKLTEPQLDQLVQAWQEYKEKRKRRLEREQAAHEAFLRECFPDRQPQEAGGEQPS